MHIDDNEQRLGSSEVSDTRAHVVDLMQYRELLISRRKLERVTSEPGWLRDRESDEFFVLRTISDADVTQSA